MVELVLSFILLAVSVEVLCSYETYCTDEHSGKIQSHRVVSSVSVQTTKKDQLSAIS